MAICLAYPLPNFPSFDIILANPYSVDNSVLPCDAVPVYQMDMTRLKSYGV